MNAITRLSMKGFRGAKDLVDYDLAPVTIVEGSNASGKSTILHGIRAAMFGTVPENCINTAATTAAAQVSFEDGTEIKTVITDKKATHYLNGKSLTKKDVAETRGKVMNLSPEIAEILFRDGQYCLDLKPEEFSKLIGNLLPKGATVDDLITGLKLSPEEEKLFRENYSGKEVDFSDIAGLFKVLSGKLTELNKKIDGAEKTSELLSATVSPYPVDVLKKRQDRLIESLKEFQNDAEAMKKYEAEVSRYEKRCSEIKELRSKLSSKPEEIPAGAIDDALRRVSRINEQLTEEAKLIAVLSETVSTNQKILDDLSSSVCPISREIVCTTDKTSAKAGLEKIISDNKSMLDIRQQRREILKNSLAASEKQVQEYRTTEKALLEYVALEERLRQLSAEKIEIPTKPEPKAVGSEEELRAELKKISDEISNAGRAEEAEKLKESVKGLRAERDIVESLRKRLAPKGDAYNFILDKVCGLLNKQMNAIAADLSCETEYEFRLTETGMTLYGKKIGETEMIPVKDMSTGERFIAHLVLTSLINQIVGLNFVILDNIDCLDACNLERVLKLITSAGYTSRFSNVILSGVNHTDTVDVVTKYASARSDFKVINLVA